ncbi:hypothetical protein BGZ72_002865 [Mortierella alpina]|nr:hypothetical protein BGZ72_002865 [Mortierella alpina]
MFLFSFITKHWPSAAVLVIAIYHILETFIVIYESHQNPEGPRIWVVNLLLILFATAPGIVAALTKRQEWVVVALSTLGPYYLFNFKVLDGGFYSALSLILYTIALRVMSLDNDGYERSWREFFTIHYTRDTSTLPFNSK